MKPEMDCPALTRALELAGLPKSVEAPKVTPEEVAESATIIALRDELRELKMENAKPHAVRELEQKVIRAALDLRKLENRLRLFKASTSTCARETGPLVTRLDEALTALAAALGEQ